MIILKGIEIENYKNIKHANLSGLRDFNILSGPNNCGKTSILNAINVLSPKFPTQGTITPSGRILSAPVWLLISLTAIKKASRRSLPASGRLTIGKTPPILISAGSSLSSFGSAGYATAEADSADASSTVTNNIAIS